MGIIFPVGRRAYFLWGPSRKSGRAVLSGPRSHPGPASGLCSGGPEPGPSGKTPESSRSLPGWEGDLHSVFVFSLSQRLPQPGRPGPRPSPGWRHNGPQSLLLGGMWAIQCLKGRGWTCLTPLRAWLPFQAQKRLHWGGRPFEPGAWKPGAQGSLPVGTGAVRLQGAAYARPTP